MSKTFTSAHQQPRHDSTVHHANSMVWAVVAFMSLGLALLSSFGLHEWAETAAFGHAMQHIILFVGGIGIGASGVNLLRRGK